MDFFDDPKEGASGADLAKPKRHECLSCFQLFASQAKLKRHSIVHSIEKKIFHCQFCDVSFRLHKELIMHEATHKRTLANINLKRCKICGIACEDDLLAHLKEHHEHFECDICKKIYHSKNHLSLHMKTHVNARDFKCSTCPKAFNFASQLKRHERSHSSSLVWYCEVCGVGFKNKPNFAHHMRRHNGDKPFQCDRCDRCFSTRQSLNLHIRIHDGKKPYKCPWEECGRCFHDLATMKVHTRVHTNENPYKCHLCGKTTKQASNLKSHYLHAHKIDYITSKTIRANARLFEKYKTENLPEAGLLEILSQQVMKNLEQQHSAAVQITAIKEEPANKRSDEKLLKEIVVHNGGNIALSHETIDNGKSQKVHSLNSSTSTVCFAQKKSELVDKFSPSLKENQEMLPQAIEIIEHDFVDDSEKSAELNIKSEIMTEVVEFQIRELEPRLTKPKTITVTLQSSAGTSSASPSKYNVEAPREELRIGKRLFKCDICPSSFKQKVKLKVHMMSHTTSAANDKCKMCEICGKTYAQSSSLRKHLKFTHSNFRPYHCEVCGRGFKDNSGLKVHLRSHSGEKPYSCSFCPKKFSTTIGRNIHQRVHTGEKPYKCQYCDSAFSDSSTYRQHIRVHTGHKPYVCHLCGRGTTQAGNLKSHLRHAHKIHMKNVTMKRN